MTRKHTAEINGFTIKSLEWDDKFDLSIYQSGHEVYRSPVILYSLKDCSSIVRRELGLKGKSIKWDTE